MKGIYYKARILQCETGRSNYLSRTHTCTNAVTPARTQSSGPSLQSVACQMIFPVPSLTSAGVLNILSCSPFTGFSIVAMAKAKLKSC